MAEAEAVPDAPSQEDLVGRVDLRQEVTFTIDGADAKGLGWCGPYQTFAKW